MAATRCPTCKKPVDLSARTRFRPFCSERCRLVDLGHWAAEDYKVEGGPAPDTEHRDDSRKRGPAH